MTNRLIWLLVAAFGILEFVNVINLFPVSRYGIITLDIDNVVGPFVALFAGLQLSRRGGRI